MKEYSETAIRQLQGMLRLVSRENPAVLTAIPDGVFEEHTKASVLSFQQAYQLPQTGTVDGDTWERLRAACREAEIQHGPAESLQLLLDPGQIIGLDEINHHLYLIHGILLAIAVYYPTMPVPPMGNLHDTASVSAVKWLQKRAALPENGVIDRKTWRYLVHLYRMVIGNGAPNQQSFAGAEAEPPANDGTSHG